MNWSFRHEHYDDGNAWISKAIVHIIITAQTHANIIFYRIFQIYCVIMAIVAINMQTTYEPKYLYDLYESWLSFGVLLMWHPLADCRLKLTSNTFSEMLSSYPIVWACFMHYVLCLMLVRRGHALFFLFFFFCSSTHSLTLFIHLSLYRDTRWHNKEWRTLCVNVLFLPDNFSE